MRTFRFLVLSALFLYVRHVAHKRHDGSRHDARSFDRPGVTRPNVALAAATIPPSLLLLCDARPNDALVDATLCVPTGCLMASRLSPSVYDYTTREVLFCADVSFFTHFSFHRKLMFYLLVRSFAAVCFYLFVVVSVPSFPFSNDVG